MPELAATRFENDSGDWRCMVSIPPLWRVVLFSGRQSAGLLEMAF